MNAYTVSTSDTLLHIMHVVEIHKISVSDELSNAINFHGN